MKSPNTVLSVLVERQRVMVKAIVTIFNCCPDALAGPKRFLV